MKKLYMLVTCVILVTFCFTFFACNKNESDGNDNSGVVDRATVVNTNLDLSTPVTLTIAGSKTDWLAMENVIIGFEKKYPNCTVEYEYVQDYSASILTRLDNLDEPVNIFMSSIINKSATTETSSRVEFIDGGYVLDLNAQSGLDLSDTFPGFIDNFASYDGALYCIPLGGEIRGLYVNKTLLASVGIDEVPGNREEFLAACAAIMASDQNYLAAAFGDAGAFGQALMYPYICSLIVNSENSASNWNAVNTCAADVEELFREPMQFLYDFVKDGYYNYKPTENAGYKFGDNTASEINSRLFFNVLDPDKDGTYVKEDDVGRFAFVVATASAKESFDETARDYNSAIDYEFTLAPVGTDGGYAYLSPASGLAINKKAPNTDWAVEFLNYLYCASVNTSFAADYGIVPNVTTAFSYVAEMYDVPEDHVLHVGEVTFDYSFYKLFTTGGNGSILVDLVKINNPSYMNNGAFYDFEHYWDVLEEDFETQRVALVAGD